MGLNQTERYVENHRALLVAKTSLSRARARLHVLAGYDPRPVRRRRSRPKCGDLHELSDARDRLTMLEQTIARLQTEIEFFYAAIGHVEPRHFHG